MKKVIKVDTEGFFLEDVILQDNETTPGDCVDIECQEGLYKPRYVDGAWVEGLSDAEIEAIKNIQPPLSDADKLKLENEQLKERLTSTETQLAQTNTIMQEFMDYVFNNEGV